MAKDATKPPMNGARPIASGKLTLAPGACVRHLRCPDWGLGIVLSVRAGEKVDVYFELHPSRGFVTLKTDPTMLRVSKAAPTPALVEYRESLGRTSARRLKGRKAPPAPPKIAQEEAVRRFLERFPKGFRDRDYLATERDYKVAAHEIFLNGLPPGDRARLFRRGEIANLVDRFQSIESRTNLLYPTEKARLRGGLKDYKAAVRFIGALFALLDAPTVTEGIFEAYARAVEALPAPGGRVDTWPVATILPFLAQPNRHMFLKPLVTKAAAHRVGVDLFYKSEINWRTYGQLLNLGAELKQRLAPYGCRDMVDVPSFIWLTD